MSTGEQLNQRQGIAERFRKNPVALKELRGRMRGPRAFIVLTIYVTLMSAFTLLLYLIYVTSNQNTVSSSGGAAGQLIFASVVGIEFFMVCFVSPAFTSGAISGERERQTFNLLRTTLLPARRLVTGKLLSALAYVLLLLGVSVPLQSLAFLMGGISLEEVLISLLLLAVTAMAFSALGILFSAMTKRTLTASILTYTAALAITIGGPVLSVVGLLIAPSGASRWGLPLVEAVYYYALGLIISSNPVAAAIASEGFLRSNGDLIYFTETLSNGTAIPLVSPWIPFTIIYIVFTIVLVLFSVRAVRNTQASD